MNLFLAGLCLGIFACSVIQGSFGVAAGALIGVIANLLVMTDKKPSGW